jgi:hypothetical protein
MRFGFPKASISMTVVPWLMTLIYQLSILDSYSFYILAQVSKRIFITFVRQMQYSSVECPKRRARPPDIL